MVRRSYISVDQADLRHAKPLGSGAGAVLWLLSKVIIEVTGASLLGLNGYSSLIKAEVSNPATV